MRSFRQTAAGRAKYAEYQKSPAGKAAARWARIKRETGFTRELFDSAMGAQGAKCAICPRALESLSETCCDHEHGTSPAKPRALLCRACNLSLGYYETWQRPAGLVIEPYERYLAQHGSI